MKEGIGDFLRNNIEIRTIENRWSMSVEELGSKLSEWLLQDHKFSIK